MGFLYYRAPTVLKKQLSLSSCLIKTTTSLTFLALKNFLLWGTLWDFEFKIGLANDYPLGSGLRDIKCFFERQGTENVEKLRLQYTFHLFQIFNALILLRYFHMLQKQFWTLTATSFHDYGSITYSRDNSKFVGASFIG